MTEVVRCPTCGKKMRVPDVHKPIWCPRCGTLFEVWFRSARVLLRVTDEVDRGGGD